MSSAKLSLGIYYFRKSVSRFSENNWIRYHNSVQANAARRVLERKNRKIRLGTAVAGRFFLSKSMPNLNFAEALKVPGFQDYPFCFFMINATTRTTTATPIRTRLQVLIILLLSLTLTLNKHVLQQLLNFTVFVQFRPVENLVQLPFVKPQAVTSAALVDEQGGCGRANDDSPHLLIADGTRSHSFGASAIDLERVEQMPRPSRLTEQKLKLAGVQPNATAIGAIIDLNILEFEGDHRIFANGTIHITSPTTQGR